MKLTIRVEMNSAAFADDGNDGRTEAARLVEIVRLRLVQGTSTDGNLLDHNGNSVGAWEIKGRRKAKSTVELGHFINHGELGAVRSIWRGTGEPIVAVEAKGKL